MQTPTNQRIKITTPTAPMRPQRTREISPSVIRGKVLFPEIPTEQPITKDTRCWAPVKAVRQNTPIILTPVPFSLLDAEEPPSRPKKRNRQGNFDKSSRTDLSRFFD